MKKVVNQDNLIRRALEYFKIGYDYFQEEYEKMINDLEFLNGEQWPTNIKAMRESDDRPCLRINKLPQFVDRVQGEMRQNRPSIKVRAVDDHGDDETADVINGILRNIEMQSDAEVVYDTGGEAMVQCGFGAWRVVSDYIDDESFDQHILIKRIKNQFAVILDPAAPDWARSLGRFGFVYEDMPRTAFKQRYPKADPIELSDGEKDYGEWAKENTVRVAEFVDREFDRKTLYLVRMPDGTETTVKSKEEIPPDGHIVKQRPIIKETLYWYKISRVEILEGPIEIPGKLIPIIPDYGKEINILGKSHYYGVVRHAKDSQRLYNYFRSMDAETIALAPKAPWLMTSAMLGSHKKSWQDSNKRNFPYLLYEVDPKLPGAKPERNFPSIANQAVLQNIMIADQELHDTTGLQLASLGKKSNEQSGKAIEARAREGDTGQFTYTSNHTRSVKHTCKVIVGMIPVVYDTARIQRIIGEDGKERTVQINQPFDDGNGQQKVFDLTVGKYDASASVGPSYETQRQESQAAMLEFMKILDPPQRQVIPDMVADNSDWHAKEELANRLRKTLPPGLIENEDQENQQPPTEEELKAQAMQETVAEMEMEKQEAELKKAKAEAQEAEANAAKAEAEAAIAEAEATQTAAGFMEPEE